MFMAEPRRGPRNVSALAGLCISVGCRNTGNVSAAQGPAAHALGRSGSLSALTNKRNSVINQTRRGTGRKLLLVHGLGGSWRSWSTILEALSAHRTVIAIDLPGHGATPAEHDSGTFNGLVGSVERYITDNGLAGIDVVGSSMGARIVLELARRGKVGNVVALDPGGFWRGWEQTFFKITIGVSGRLVRAIRPGLPMLSRNGTTIRPSLGARSAGGCDGVGKPQHNTDIRRTGP